MTIEDVTVSREFLENIVNMTGDGIYVTDELGCIIMANRALCDMTGFSRSELIGMYGAELLAPDSISLFDVFYSKGFDAEKSTFEAHYYKKDGTQLPVDLKIANMHGTAELAAGIIVSVRDITERKQAENQLIRAQDELRQSRDFFENVFNMAGDGIFVTDEAGCIIMVNRAMCNITGFSYDELIGTYGADLIAPDSLPSFETFFNNLFADEGNAYEAAYYRKNGSQCPVDLKIANLSGAAESSAGVIVSVRDITERKQAENELRKAQDELRRSRDFFQNVFNMAGDGIHVVDESGAIVFANKAMCTMLGYELSELVGRPAVDIISQTTSAGLDEKDVYSRDYSDYFEVVYQRKDGMLLTVEARITNIQYGSQTSEALVVSVRDITERKRAAIELKKAYDELQRSRDFFENVFNMAGDGICVTDEIGTIVFVNRALLDMLGYSADELIGKPAIEITPDLSGCEEYASMVREMYDMDYANYFECLYQHKDGAILPVEAKVTNVHYDNEASSAIIITVRDITERKRFEHEIKAANDDLEQKVAERTLNLEEVNTALRVLLKGRDQDRVSLEEKLVGNVKELVFPYIEKMQQMKIDSTHKVYLDIVASNLNDIISPFLKKVKHFNLTPSEIQIANFIKHGKNTKEIAALLNLSTRTVEGHRDSIRKKLLINTEKTNLRTYLSSLD